MNQGIKLPSVKNIVSSMKRNQEDRFIPDTAILSHTVEHLKISGYKIVLTQGVYDLLHRGHNRYLEAAKSCGDVLIVGVDSDELTRKRKPSSNGIERPFDPLADRVEMLLHTRHVDIVTVREAEHGIDDLIMAVRPDVLITSETTTDFSDEKKEFLKQYCGEVKVLSAQADTSTTARIRRFMAGGASELAAAIHVMIEQFTKQMKDLLAQHLPFSDKEIHPKTEAEQK